MRSVGKFLPGNLVSAQFFFCLRGTKQICRKFGTPHVIQNLLILCQAFPLMDIFPVKTSVQSLVPEILEYAIIFIGSYSGILSGTCKTRIMLFHFITQDQPFFVFGAKSGIKIFLRSPYLYCKIRLCLSDNGFTRIGVLHAKVTRITRQMNIIYLTFST